MLLALVHALVQIPAGRVTDRIRPRGAVLAAALLVVGCNAVALLTPDTGLAMVMRALMGVGTGMGFIAGTQYIREIGAVAQGVFGGSALGGAGLAVAVMPALAGAFESFRTPFVAGAALALLSLVLLAGAPLGPEAARRGAARSEPRFFAPGSLFRDPGVYRLAVIHMAGMGLAILVANWVVLLLERAGDVEAGVAGLLGSLTLLLGIGTRPLGGWIFHRRPSWLRRALAIGIATCTIGTGLVAIGGPLPVVTLGAVLIGLAAGLPFAPSFTGTALRRPEAPGTAVGFVNTLGNGVVVVGTPLLGLAFSLPGDGRIGFAIVAAIWAASLLALPSNEELGVADRIRGRSAV